MIPILVYPFGIAAAALGLNEVRKRWHPKLSPTAYNRILDAIGKSTDPIWLEKMSAALIKAGYPEMGQSVLDKAHIYRDAAAAKKAGKVYRGDPAPAGLGTGKGTVTLPETTITAGYRPWFMR